MADEIFARSIEVGDTIETYAAGRVVRMTVTTIARRTKTIGVRGHDPETGVKLSELQLFHNQTVNFIDMSEGLYEEQHERNV